MKHTDYTSPNAFTMPDYWEDAWKCKNVPDAIDPRNDAPENHFYQVLHALFVRALDAHCPHSSRS